MSKCKAQCSKDANLSTETKKIEVGQSHLMGERVGESAWKTSKDRQRWKPRAKTKDKRRIPRAAEGTPEAHGNCSPIHADLSSLSLGTEEHEHDAADGRSMEVCSLNDGNTSDIRLERQEREPTDSAESGEESVIPRLQRIVKGFVAPSLSQAELEANTQEQTDEILALESIYGENFTPLEQEHSSSPSFMISVHLEVPGSLRLVAENSSTSTSSETDNPFRASTNGNSSVGFTVQSLPPIHLACTLPPSYPSHSGPLFCLSGLWLSSTMLSELCSELDSAWNEHQGQVVIFLWTEWLLSQCLLFLGVVDELHLGPYGASGLVVKERERDLRALSTSRSFDADISRLLQYSEERKNQEFCESLHLCNICFCEELGKDFTRLPCQHIFCWSCMQTYSAVHVKDGSVNKLNCPDTSCGGSIPPYILKQLLAEGDFQRWETLVLQRTLDAMADIVYCPRCEAVCIEEEQHFVQCGGCFFSFCSLCRQTWHVGQECMSAEERLTILRERQNRNTTGDEQKKKEKQLLDEVMNLHYVRREAKQCPKCKMAISKIEGCNKMVCSNCQQIFCFRCGKAIDGYSHFGDGSCQLFEPEEVQGEVARWERRYFVEQEQAQIQLELWPERGKPCPNCRQPNVKMGNNNHILCWSCRSSFCALCSKVVRRTADHYGLFPPKCRQHTVD